jgi:hypothetical protein
MTNELSQPQIVVHNCPEHGPQISAPSSYDATCRCGKRCEVDVDAWVATQRDQRPDEDVEQLARESGLIASTVRAALDRADAP